MIPSSSESLRELIAQSPDLLYQYRLYPDRAFEYVSPAATTLTGHTPDEFYADPDLGFKLVHPDDRPLLEALMRGEVPSGATLTLRWVRKDGRIVWTEQRSVLLYDEMGILTGISGIVRDVTTQKTAEAEQAQALSQARAAEARFRGLLEAAPDAIVISDSHGRIVYVNQQAELLFGYARDALLGQSVEILIPERFRLQHVEHRATYAAAPRTRPMGVGLDLYGRHKDGHEIPLEISLSPLEVDGALLVIAAIRNVSERKRAEAERARLLAQEQATRARLEAILRHAPHGILFVDAQSGYVHANPKAVELFGRELTPEGGRAQYVGQLYHPNGRPLSDEELLVSRALRGETIPEEERLIVQPNGQRVPVLTSAAPVYDQNGEIIGAIAAFQDISTLKALERLREEWALVIAHDLRQPIAAISMHVGVLQFLLERGTAPEPVYEALGHIRTAARNLNQMISDLLDFSRIEARRLTLERRPLDLCAFVHAVLERTEALTHGHPVHLEIHGTIPWVAVDPGRIEQVLANLLSNAAKYGYPGTEIGVTVERVEGAVQISVTNEGPGIPVEELPRLFTRFYRVRRSRWEGMTGLGLGLYISHGLVEAHGGRIWAESIPGKTTTFYFTLPLEPQPAREGSDTGPALSPYQEQGTAEANLELDDADPHPPR